MAEKLPLVVRLRYEDHDPHQVRQHSEVCPRRPPRLGASKEVPMEANDAARPCGGKQIALSCGAGISQVLRHPYLALSAPHENGALGLRRQ